MKLNIWSDQRIGNLDEVISRTKYVNAITSLVLFSLVWLYTFNQS